MNRKRCDALLIPFYSAYLMFCKRTNSDVWLPTKDTVLSGVVTIQNTLVVDVNNDSNDTDSKDLDTLELDDIGDVIDMSSSFSSDEDSDGDFVPSGEWGELSRPRKKLEKMKKSKDRSARTSVMSEAKLDYDKLMEEISISCSICTPIGADALREWDQTKYDKVMSRHLWFKHKVKDELMLENDHNKKLLSQRSLLPDKIMVDDAMRIPCKQFPTCPTYFTKALDYRRHELYHIELIRLKIKHDGFARQPCLHENCSEEFANYHDLRRHEDAAHAKFEFRCRLCESTFRSRHKVRDKRFRVRLNG